jgi:Carbohydrate binding module (family 6)
LTANDPFLLRPKRQKTQYMSMVVRDCSVSKRSSRARGDGSLQPTEQHANLQAAFSGRADVVRIPNVGQSWVTGLLYISRSNFTVPVAGSYKFDFRLASPFTGNAIQLKKGTTMLSTLSVANTCNWQVYQTISAANISLTAATNDLRITIATGGWNFNWFDVSK